MSRRLVNGSIMVLISMAICLMLAITLTHEGWSTTNDNASPITIICTDPHGGCGEPPASLPA